MKPTLSDMSRKRCLGVGVRSRTRWWLRNFGYVVADVNGRVLLPDAIDPFSSMTEMSKV